MRRRHPNSPAHLLIDDAPYFITGATYQKRKLLQNADLKQLLLNKIRAKTSQFGWTLEHWVILDNHYHLMPRSRYGKDSPELMRRIHGGSAGAITKAAGRDRPVGWNYWDNCSRDERDDCVRLNYLLYNPIKHGYVSDLKDYPDSGFHQHFQSLGKEKLAQQFRNHPKFRSLDLEDDF